MATPQGPDEPEKKPKPATKPTTPATTAPPQPATVPDDAEMDLPPDGTPDLIKVEDPDAKHRRVVDMTKLRFAIIIVAACLIFVGVTSLVQYGLQQQLNDSSALSNAIDWMKVIATTALGFVFGRSTLDKEKKDS